MLPNGTFKERMNGWEDENEDEGGERSLNGELGIYLYTRLFLLSCSIRSIRTAVDLRGQRN